MFQSTGLRGCASNMTPKRPKNIWKEAAKWVAIGTCGQRARPGKAAWVVGDEAVFSCSMIAGAGSKNVCAG